MVKTVDQFVLERQPYQLWERFRGPHRVRKILQRLPGAIVPFRLIRTGTHPGGFGQLDSSQQTVAPAIAHLVSGRRFGWPKEDAALRRDRGEQPLAEHQIPKVQYATEPLRKIG